MLKQTPSINRARYKADLAALAGIGRDEATKILQRERGSEAELAAQLWLRRRIESAGIAASTPSLKREYAHRGESDARREIFILGDTAVAQNAGPLAGALGLVAGLECLRVMREHEIAANVGMTLAADCESTEALRFSIEFAAPEHGATSQASLRLGFTESSFIEMHRLAALVEKDGVALEQLSTQHQPATPGAWIKLLIDPALDHWPIDASAWLVIELAAQVLLDLLSFYVGEFPTGESTNTHSLT